MVYYGVSYSSPFVGGNVYLNFFITSTVALVAYPALAWGCNRFVFYYNVMWAPSAIQGPVIESSYRFRSWS